MCRHCITPPDGRLRLGRRSFVAMAASVAPSCLTAASEDLVEPRISLRLPAGAPPTVALTLDACSGGVDMRIIDTLIALSVPATIFATAIWLRANGPTVGLLRGRADLFTLQNHGELHLPPVLGARHVYGLPVAGSLAGVRREVERGADAIAATGARRPTWYRGAAGLYSPAALGFIEAAIAGYSLVGDEGASLPAAEVAHRIGAAVSGDIIVAHVNQPHRSSGAGVAAGIRALQPRETRFTDLDGFPTTPPVCRVHPAGPRIG